uniref:Death domain containing 1 n=1 Tax=Echeneis naucrates TaxID=173247 RepID=A0A665WNX9_ECHNA
KMIIMLLFSEVMPSSDSIIDTLQSVVGDTEIIMKKLGTIVTNLDAEILKLSSEETSCMDAALAETRDPDTSMQPEDGNRDFSSPDPCESDPNKEEDNKSHTSHTNAKKTSSCNDVKNTEKVFEIINQVSNDEDCVSPACQNDLMSEAGKNAEKTNIRGKDNHIMKQSMPLKPFRCCFSFSFVPKRSDDMPYLSFETTHRLTGKLEDSQSNVPDVCFVKAPTGVAEVLKCEVADSFSCLVVTGSEELVSRVIRVKVQGRDSNVCFPVTVVVPFCARYRGNYRDVAVKIMDGERRTSYVTPVTTEGTYGRGSFAEVKVYSLGIFAVVSCLKRENYTIPKRGLSLKLPMDPRICLNYLPGCFTLSPHLLQVQPIDTAVLAAVKSRREAYYSVVSTSPVLYLTHPTSQPLRRPLTVTLPCPPNPERKRKGRGQGEETEHRHICSVSPSWDRSSQKETSNELLIVLGSKDKQWRVLEKITVRSQQNGLASFELLLVRLLSPLQSCHLTSLAEELEESVGCHAVTVILQRRQDEPHAVLVAALPSRDLSWELNKLRAQGYSGLLEASSDVSMREGDQLLLRFSGNITSAGTCNNQNDIPLERIAFHNQRMNHLLVHLTEVDPFGNYSSPHYKGTAVFYKVTRGELEWRGHEAVLKDVKLLGDPVYSLPDSLLLWLAGELSEEEIALLALSLRLRRSAAQLVKLRAGDSLSMQAFHLLAMWRRALPAVLRQPKASHLAHCLAKSGRPDLARELHKVFVDLWAIILGICVENVNVHIHTNHWCIFLLHF